MSGMQSKLDETVATAVKVLREIQQELDELTAKAATTATQSSRKQAFDRAKTTRPRERAAEKDKNLEMPGPLSELTKDSNVELLDIESYINRSAEKRSEERRANGGTSKRPANAYVLYRMAYNNRFRAHFPELKRQPEICRLIGLSWRQEPAELKQRFTEYAKVEHQNLLTWDPSYRYAPKRKRKRNDSLFTGVDGMNNPNINAGSVRGSDHRSASLENELQQLINWDTGHPHNDPPINSKRGLSHLPGAFFHSSSLSNVDPLLLQKPEVKNAFTSNWSNEHDQISDLPSAFAHRFNPLHVNPSLLEKPEIEDLFASSWSKKHD